MFSTLTLLVALVGHAALWIGCVNRLHAIGLRKLVKEAFTNVCFAVLFAVPLIVAWRWWSRGASLAGMVGTDSSLAIYLAACVPVAAFVGASRLWHLVGGERRGVVSQHSLRWVDFGADGGRDRLVSPGVARVISRLPGNQLLRLAVEEKTLRIPNLPSGLEGLKIAHLSDLHMSGRIHADYYAQTVDIANEWRPDIVALTGDLVENSDSLDSIKSTLGRLEARCGVYFVLGNHDAHGDSDELRRRLVDCGHVDVGGRWLDREVNGAKLRLAGNELPWFRPAADLMSAPNDVDATFALVHGPDQMGWARRHGVSLVLAGHNHGGQIRFPLIGPIVSPSLQGVRYASGAFRHGATVMHVTRGTGTLAPIRLNCPPELALLRLIRG